MTAPAESVLHRLMRIEMEKNVQGAVAKLSPEHRIVIVLRYTEGLAYERSRKFSGVRPERWRRA